MKLSTEKTICVRPQVNMATVLERMKDTQNLSSQLENEVKDAEADEALRTFNVVMAYINGPNFQQSINHIDKTIKDAQDARNCLSQMRTYVNTNIDKSIKFQNSIEENLNGAKDLIWKLRELLNSNSPDFN